MRSSVWAAIITFASCSIGQAVSIERKIESFELRVCAPNGSRCVIATAPKAVASHFRPLFYMANLKARIDSVTHNPVVWENAHGYYDMELNQLVLEPKVNAKWAETVIDLEALEPIQLHSK